MLLHYRGNSGIGLETVMELASAGCRVILCSRDVEAGKAAVIHNIHRSGSSENSSAVQDIVVLQLDLADLDSIEALVSTVRKSEKRLDFLVLNAGVLATPLGYTKQVASSTASASANNYAETSPQTAQQFDCGPAQLPDCFTHCHRLRVRPP